jgi:Domain of unknown function (DUF4266)
MMSGSRPQWLTKRSLGGELKRNASRLAIVCCGGLLLAASACATVAPYERERLARPDMELGRNGDAHAGEEHATAYREGSSGGMGSSGGGCGCN